MTTEELLLTLAKKGIHLQPGKDDALDITAPVPLDDSQLDYIRANKQALLEALKPLPKEVLEARITTICENEGIDAVMVMRGLQGETTPILAHELTDICLLFAGRLTIH